jgi:amino acid transporter
MRRVDPRTHTPVPATILIVVIGVILMAALPGAAQLELITASTILPAIVYLAVRKRLDRKKGAFDLGRFELPVAIGALADRRWALLRRPVGVQPGGAADRAR